MVVVAFLPVDLDIVLFKTLPFLISTVFLCSVISRIGETGRKSEFILSDRRKEIIKQNAVQNSALRFLARATSPQVRKKVVSGNEIGISHKEISCMFIDIVNSTEAVSKLAEEILSPAITLFLDHIVPILLRFNLILDKYTGDGFVVFSTKSDSSTYISDCVKAGHMVIEKIKSESQAYKEVWGAPLQIKVAVSNGLAPVGFFSSTSGNFHTYTSIGLPVITASRIESLCEPNSIFICSDTKEKLENDKTFAFVRMGKPHLKGIGDTDIYSVTVERSVEDGSSIYCPEGHGEMVFDTNEKGHYVYRCPVCNYELD